MRYSIPLIASLSAFVSADQWGMTSWTGTACESGLSGSWAVGPNTNSCITFASVESLYVNTAGPCTTTYFHDSTCSTEAYAANQGICNGFNGGPVGSFKISCTA